MSDPSEKQDREPSPDDTLPGEEQVTPSQQLRPGTFSNLPEEFYRVKLDLNGMSAEDVSNLLIKLDSGESIAPRVDLSSSGEEAGGVTAVIDLETWRMTKGEYDDHKQPSAPHTPTQPAHQPEPEKPYDPEAPLFEEPTTPAKKKKSSTSLEFIQSILVALLLAILIRVFVFEAFKIPSGSMEPTLIGDTEYGDHVAVNKLSYRFGEVNRGDIVVFKKPGASKNLIKRCMGLPGEQIELSGGEIFVNGTILRKDLDQMSQFWRPYFNQKDFRQHLIERNWRSSGTWKGDNKSIRGIGPAELHYIPWMRTLSAGRIESATIKDVYIRFVAVGPQVSKSGERFNPSWNNLYWHENTDTARRLRGFYPPSSNDRIPYENREFWQDETGKYDVNDLRLDIAFVPHSSAGVLTLNIAEGNDENRTVRTLSLPLGIEDGRPSLDDGKGRVKTLTKPVQFLPNQQYKVSFQNIDDRLVFYLNDELLAEHEYDGAKGYTPGNEIFITLSDGADISIREVEIYRDIFYEPRSRTFSVPADSYFMLGDNSPTSNDSREWGDVERSAIIGRAFMVFWPLDRLVWLKGGK